MEQKILAIAKQLEGRLEEIRLQTFKLLQHQTLYQDATKDISYQYDGVWAHYSPKFLDIAITLQVKELEEEKIKLESDFNNL